MKKFSFLFLFGFLVSLTLPAATSPGGKEYTIKKDGLYFSGTTELTLVDADWIEDLVVPDDINGYHISAIAEDAFANRIDIESLKVGPMLRTIGKNAFKGCSYLKAVDLSKSFNLSVLDYAFSDCQAINALDLGQATNLVLGYLCFDKSLLDQDLTIPSGITLNYGVFKDTRLKNVVFEGGINYSSGYGGGQYIFSNATRLVSAKFNTETNLNQGMFDSCTSLKQVTLANGTTILPNYIFKDCTALEDIINADKITAIGYQSFMNSGLTHFDFTNVETIGTDAFKFARLKEITITDKLQYSGYLTKFSDLHYVSRINYPSMEKFYVNMPGVDNSSAFNPDGFEVYINGSPLIEVTIPTSMTNIAAFNNINTLKKVIIPNFAVKYTIGGNAFRRCTNLETVEIGAGEAIVADYAFSGCPNLVNFTMSEKNRCTAFSGSHVFSESGPLTNLNIPNVKDIGSSCFYRTTAENINLPNVEKAEYMVDYETTSVKNIYMPKLQTVNFTLPASLETADFESVTEFSSGYYGTKHPYLTSIIMTSAKSVPSYFLQNTKISELKLPNLISAGESAFANSANLLEIDLPSYNDNCLKLFDNSPSLQKISFGGNIKRLVLQNLPSIRNIDFNGEVEDFNAYQIGADANSSIVFLGKVNSFGKLTGQINKVIFQNDVNTIGMGAFGGSEKIKTLEFGGRVGSTTGSAFYKVTTLKEIKFANLDNWLDIKINLDNSNKTYADGMPGCGGTDIDYYLIRDGVESKIEDLVIPAGKSVKRDAFINSTIKTVSFEPSETEISIEEGAFYRTHYLESVSVPGNVKTIGVKSFYECTDLKDLSLQEGIRSLESNAFAYCSSLESVKLPESVTSLGSDCFAFNSSLKSITISPKVEDVPFGFVYECDKLERLIIPEGVKTLGGEIVSGRSTALDFISLPSTLSSMSTSRYQSLKNLDRNVVIYSWALNPPYAPMEDFQELEVHVCEKALAAYKNDNVWSKAILVGDLTQEHTLVVDGIDVIITVPQNDINGQAKVSIYKVVVTPEYADGSHGESSEFIFDGKGNPIGGPEMQVKAKAPAGGTQLKIEGLDPDTKYQFELKGYTADRSLVYSGQYTVTTGISGVTDMEISESDAKFYNLYGVYLGNDVDALSPGLYIVVTDKGTFKWCK